MRSSLPAALAHIEHYEGGFVNHPKDPGRATNRGITIGTYRALIDPAGTIEDIRNLSRETALAIYRDTYWTAVNGDGLPPGLDLTVFGFGVNAGPRRAARMLQRLVGAAQDGKIGPLTLERVWDQMGAELLERYRDARLTYYRSLRTWETFGRGWTRRTHGAHSAAMTLWTAYVPELLDDEPEPDDLPMPAERVLPPGVNPFMAGFYGG